MDEGGFELAEGVSMSEGADFELDDELQKTDDDEGESVAGESGEKETGSEDVSGGSDEDGAEEGDGTTHPVAASGDALLDISC